MFTVQKGILSTRDKPSVSFGKSIALSTLPRLSVADVDSSMKTRRDTAWKIVDEVWQPVSVSDGQIPLWMTWYEQEDIEELYQDMVTRVSRPISLANARMVVTRTMARHRRKNMRESLSSKRLGRVLRQFTFKGMPNLGPNRKASTGSIYYSPSYVTHLLESALTIANSDPSAYPQPSESFSSRNKVLSLTDLPRSLRPKNPDNQYALCMDSEMPSDAVMVKTAWTPVIVMHANNTIYEGVTAHQFDTSKNMAAKLNSGTFGEWIENPLDLDFNGTMVTQGLSGFTITDENGDKWMLTGMHIASKSLRTWMWISLIASAWPWFADMPDDSPIMTFSAVYGLTVVSDFAEKDSSPGSHYVGLGTTSGKKDLYADLSEVLNAIAGVMNGSQWGSNPYIESTMAKGNCIGCHQGTTEAFLSKTTTKKIDFNVSDFSFSFTTNRSNIRKIRGM